MVLHQNLNKKHSVVTNTQGKKPRREALKRTPFQHKFVFKIVFEDSFHPFCVGVHYERLKGEFSTLQLPFLEN